MKKGIKSYLGEMLEKLKEGLPSEDLRGEGKSTKYELLGILKNAGLVYKDENEGKHYYTWRKEKQELLERFFYPETPEDYERRLRHSRELFQVDGKFVLDRVGWTDRIVREMLMEEDKELSPRRLLLQHISYYPEVYDLYKKLKDQLKEADEDKSTFYELRSKIEELALKVKHGRTLRGVCDACPPVSILNLKNIKK